TTLFPASHHARSDRGRTKATQGSARFMHRRGRPRLPSCAYLAAAGIGTLGIVDFDRVDLTNLQRQVLHGTKDVGRSKLASARDRLRDINPEIELKLHECRFSSGNAEQIVADYDVVVDGSDNFATRYLSNDVCVFARKPNVYGSVFRFEGQ